jgi:hypothetical protein
LGYLLLAIAGCGSGNDLKDPPASFFRLKAISLAYVQATDQLERAPQSKDDIIPFLKQQGDPQELLRSSVDDQDFVINWGIDYRKMNPQERYSTVTAYEKVGSSGKRWVLQYRTVSLATESELAKMTFPPGAERP